MYKHYSFTVPGRPSGKARPRTYRVKTKEGTTKPVTHSPDPGWFQYNVRKAAQEADIPLTEGPVSVWVQVQRRMPKSFSRKKRMEMDGRWSTSGADAANIESAIHDALEGIAYPNDRQIVQSHFERRWADKDQVYIVVEFLN